MKKILFLLTVCIYTVIYAPDCRMPQFAAYLSYPPEQERHVTNPDARGTFPAVPGECQDPSLTLTPDEVRFSKYIKGVNPRIPAAECETLARMFAATGDRAELLLAMAAVESEFRVKVYGDQGTSVGLMQISKDWYRKICGSHADEHGFDPEVNLHIANVLVTGLYHKFRRIAPNADEGTILRAVTDGYNRGDERAYRAFRSDEAPTYHVKKVMRQYTRLKAL